MCGSAGRSVWFGRLDKVGSRLGTDDDVSYCIYGAGRGGRTPTRLPSADFESDFRHFAGCCIATQEIATSILFTYRYRRV